MDRQFYLDLASGHPRMPIGTHLVLHQHPDHSRIVFDGRALGEVVCEAAERFSTPLAVPLMDLTLEKAALLQACGVPSDCVDTYHFESPPGRPDAWVETPRMRATCEAIRYVASTDRIPVGMGIGPFSLTTKLLADPITPVFLAGTADHEDPEVRLLDNVIELATDVCLNYIERQIEAGAKAVIICEPAANKVYFSPNQLNKSYAVFDRLVMEPNRRIRELLASRGADLIFHNCGELVDDMVQRFCSLDPAILSLGSSRELWRDAAIVPKTTVLYGNLPTKKFYSDALINIEQVQSLTLELDARMREAGHPFILGSECDVLSVPGHEETIAGKVAAFMNTRAQH